MNDLPTLSLNASVAVPLKPDKAIVTLGVVSRSTRSAEDAMAGAREIMNRIVESVRRFGVEPRDVQTSQLSLADHWHHQQSVREHSASNQLTIRLRAIERLGEMLDAVVAGGANAIAGVAFGAGDPAAARDEARRAALREVQGGAALYAAAGGYARARLKTLNEHVNVAGERAHYAHAQHRAAPAGPTPVEAGELNVTVQLSAVYELMD